MNAQDTEYPNLNLQCASCSRCFTARSTHCGSIWHVFCKYLHDKNEDEYFIVNIYEPLFVCSAYKEGLTMEDAEILAYEVDERAERRYEATH